MKKIKSALLLLCIGVALSRSSFSQAPIQVQKTVESEAKELPIPTEFKDKVQEEYSLGQILKIYDDVAWIGTDAIYAADYKLKPGVKGGYIVEPMSNDLNGIYQLMFVNELNGHPMAVAYAVVKHDSDMGHVEGAKVLNPPQELSTQARLMYQALATAERAPDLKFCKATYNTVVFAYVNKGKIEYRVYFLMSTKKKGEIPIGGHILVRVSADTKTVLEVKPLAKSCLMGQNEDDPRVVAIDFSDLDLDSPSAAQVFLMWRYQKPVYMATNNGMLWAIDSRGIRLLREGNKALDEIRVQNTDVPTWIALSNSGNTLEKSQVGCTAEDQCDIDPTDIPKDTSMIVITHLPITGAPNTGEDSSSLGEKAIALSREVPGAGDWEPLASNLVVAILTPNNAHYAIEGSAQNPKVRYLGGGDEKLGKYAAEHWHKGMTDNDIVHLIESYLSQSGQQPWIR